ncbi:hypothetical protein ACVWZA_003435 [Sphingomonas sp. UYAg733]
MTGDKRALAPLRDLLCGQPDLPGPQPLAKLFAGGRENRYFHDENWPRLADN